MKHAVIAAAVFALSSSHRTAGFANNEAMNAFLTRGRSVVEELRQEPDPGLIRGAGWRLERVRAWAERVPPSIVDSLGMRWRISLGAPRATDTGLFSPWKATGAKGPSEIPIQIRAGDLLALPPGIRDRDLELSFDAFSHVLPWFDVADLDGDGVEEVLVGQEWNGGNWQGSERVADWPEKFKLATVWRIERGDPPRAIRVPGPAIADLRKQRGSRAVVRGFGPYVEVTAPSDACGNRTVATLLRGPLLTYRREDAGERMQPDRAASADEVAKACPATGRTDDLKAIALRIACERLLGRSSATVIEKYVVPFTTARPCAQRELLERWATTEPPFVIRQTHAR